MTFLGSLVKLIVQTAIGELVSSNKTKQAEKAKARKKMSEIATKAAREAGPAKK